MVVFDKKNIRSWSLLGIAPSLFINAVADIMEHDPNTYLMTADTGRYCGFQKMNMELSDRMINVGIAEQNMLGIAAGLALEGKQVFVTTYAPFLAFRAADQMRHLAGNCNLNIKMIGTAAGFSAAASGTALLAINDIAMARAIPNVTILSPADCTEAMKMIFAMPKINGPVYMRFSGLSNLPIVYNDDFEYVVGKANVLVKGKKIALLATGTTIVAEARKAGDMIMKAYGIQPTIADIHTLKPLDTMFVKSLIEDHELIITIEEHSIIGGLGAAVCEVLAEIGTAKRVIRLGVEDVIYKSGNRNYMIEQCGLNAEQIFKRALKEIHGEHNDR